VDDDQPKHGAQEVIRGNNTNSLSKIKFMEEGNHMLFVDIEDRLGRPAVGAGNPQSRPMRWSVPAAKPCLGQVSLFERQSEFEN
jgi:hypothetical protein